MVSRKNLAKAVMVVVANEACPPFYKPVEMWEKAKNYDKQDKIDAWMTQADIRFEALTKLVCLAISHLPSGSLSTSAASSLTELLATLDSSGLGSPLLGRDIFATSPVGQLALATPKEYGEVRSGRDPIAVKTGRFPITLDDCASSVLAVKGDKLQRLLTGARIEPYLGVRSNPIGVSVSPFPQGGRDSSPPASKSPLALPRRRIFTPGPVPGDTYTKSETQVCCDCKGRGSSPGLFSNRPCVRCKGTGKLTIERAYKYVSKRCRQCSGKGKVGWFTECTRCEGSGKVLRSEECPWFPPPRRP